MRKEIIWVAAIGIVIGLIFAFGIYRINSALPKQNPPQASSAPEGGSQEFNITLDKPEDGDVITQNTLTVTGITRPDSYGVISGEKGDYIFKTDSTGVFGQDIELAAGVNQIRITAFDSKGLQSVQKVLVVYSSSFQEKTVPTPAANSTSESDIRAKVEEKVLAALNRPKAYLGTVTDIADSTIQIKSTQAKIEQISTDDNVSVVNQTGKNNKIIKLADIAIGDFVIAMGYVNGNSVLAAQRILVTDPVTEPKINATIAKVSDTSKKSLSVSQMPNGSPDTITPDKNTDIESFDGSKSTTAKFAAISKAESLIYVLDTTGTPSTVRSIFLLPQSQNP